MSRSSFRKSVKIFTCFITLLVFSFLSKISVKATTQLNVVGADMPRLKSLETIFLNIMVAIWALSIPYFLFNIVYIGFLYMTSMGDETKAASAKGRGGKLVLSAIILFGGWLVVNFLMNILNLKGGECLDGTPVTEPFFRFFFTSAC